MVSRIGIATWNFAGGTLAERIVHFAGMGFDAVSLIAREAVELAGGKLPEVEATIAHHGLKITAHGGLAPRGEPVDPRQVLTDFRSLVAWQERTGALATVNFDAAKTPEGERRVDEMHEVLEEMLSISEGAGFTIGIEDWPLTPDQLAPIDDLREFSHFGVLLDLGHLNLRLRKGGDPADAFPSATAREQILAIDLPINELHVHNNDGTRDMHAPPDSGTADLPGVAQALVHKGIDCISTIELVPAWCGLTDQEGMERASQAMRFWSDALSQRPPRSYEIT